MVTRTLRAGVLPLALLSGCGLENWFGNIGHTPYDRPASAISGATSWTAPSASQIQVSDGDGNAITAFATDIQGGGYRVKLPSAKYSFVVVHGRVGDADLRALVPSLGEETLVGGADLDARSMTEVLIVEARLSADAVKFKKLTPSAYVGDGVTSGTRTLIRQNMNVAGPTQDLLHMVERIMARIDPLASLPDPYYFVQPVLSSSFQVTTSPLNPGNLQRNPFDIDGDGVAEASSARFDAKLAEVAQLYQPAGCLDANHIRLMFSVDFNQGALNGNGGSVNRFKWAVDKPNKSMFFVGWIYTRPGIPSSDITSADADPALATQARDLEKAMGNATPNTIPMYDDGTNGDEVAGDGIWTVTFDVPKVAGKLLRIGYKYTWGTRGVQWTGTEEWPGNARIIEVVDVNVDGFVYRRDVFGDEATNKDYQNLSLSPLNHGNITWTTELRPPCGPESHEQMVTLHNAQTCGSWITPQSVGPITVACPTGP